MPNDIDDLQFQVSELQNQIDAIKNNLTKAGLVCLCPTCYNICTNYIKVRVKDYYNVNLTTDKFVCSGCFDDQVRYRIREYEILNNKAMSFYRCQNGHFKDSTSEMISIEFSYRPGLDSRSPAKTMVLDNCCVDCIPFYNAKHDVVSGSAKQHTKQENTNEGKEA